MLIPSRSSLQCRTSTGGKTATSRVIFEETSRDETPSSAALLRWSEQPNSVALDLPNTAWQQHHLNGSRAVTSSQGPSYSVIPWINICLTTHFTSLDFQLSQSTISQTCMPLPRRPRRFMPFALPCHALASCHVFPCFLFIPYPHPPPCPNISSSSSSLDNQPI